MGGRRFQHILISSTLVITLGSLLACGTMVLGVRAGAMYVPERTIVAGPLVLMSDMYRHPELQQTTATLPVVHMRGSSRYLLMRVAIPVVDDQHYWLLALLFRRPQ